MECSLSKAVYLAPLRELLVTEPPDFTVWLHGRSGLFKSEVAALAQAHWGDFSRMTLPASFVATGNALERLTFATKDAILVCDDYFPARNRREADAMDQTAARLLRGVGNGSGRSRMRRDTTMRPDLPPRGVTLATGERLPDGYSTNARLFLLSLTPTAQDDIASRLAKAQVQGTVPPRHECLYPVDCSTLGHAPRHPAKRFRELRRLAYAPGNHFRQPSQIAYLQLAWEVFTTFALEVGALDPDSRTALPAGRLEDAHNDRTAAEPGPAWDEVQNAASWPCSLMASPVSTPTSKISTAIAPLMGMPGGGCVSHATIGMVMHITNYNATPGHAAGPCRRGLAVSLPRASLPVCSQSSTGCKQRVSGRVDHDPQTSSRWGNDRDGNRIWTGTADGQTAGRQWHAKGH